MERNREARRSNLQATSDGLPRRRQRSNNLRDSPEDGVMEMQETVRLRERASKGEIDRDLLNRSKRRRADKVVLQGSNNREEGEENTEESSGEEDNETEQLSNRNISPSARVSRQVPTLKATDEMISFPVPRKARSASVKRSHESWVAGNGGFMEEQNDRRASISSVRRSVESDRVSPSSNGSFRKKMKTNGPKTRLLKATKSSNSVQEDIDIEIAEVLYGLRKQSQSSKREDSARNPLPKLKSEDVNGFSTDTKPSVSPQISGSAQSQSQTTVFPDTLVGVASKKKKVEAEDSPTPVKVANEQWAKMEICSLREGKKSGRNALISDYNLDKDAFKTASVLMESRENEVITKHGDSKPSFEEEPNSVDGAVTREKSLSTEKESANLDVDFNDSTVINAISSKVESQLEEKFKIDLMAPPMASSPESDSPADIELDPKDKVLDTELKIETLATDEEKVLTKEARAEDGEDSKDKKMDSIREKRDSLNLDLEKPLEDSRSDCCKFEQHGQKQPFKVGMPKLEKTSQSTSVPVPINLAGWPNGLPPLGYMPPFQTVAPLDGSIRSSIALQPPHFLLSPPRPKRCAMHHYIARNIQLHQRFTKMNHIWPAAPGSSLCGAKLNNLHVVPSAENLILGNPLQGSFPVVNLNPTEEEGKVAASFPGITRKDKNSDRTNFMDTAQRKQAVVQQASEPASAGNLMHSPALIFPLSQHQTTANQSGPSKSATSTNKASLIKNSATGISTSSTALTGVAAAVSFNYPNLGANEASYLTILQNNGYPFAIAASVGNPSAIRGGTPTQVLPFFNGSFYSSQMFHPQHQQQAHSQPLVQPAYQNAVTSSGSSSSHKQPESQQLQGAQVSGNNFSSSTSMHSQQLHKYHVLPSNQPRKMEPEIHGENITVNTQKSVYGQNPAFPQQPLNYALVPSAMLGGGSVNGNHSEKQLSQQKNLKGGVDLVPPQAFAMSFASFTGNNVASNLNFSSMAQSPTIFHSLPDMARQGYQVASVPQTSQKKNRQISDGKNGAGSTNLDDGKKVSSGKLHTTNGQTYVFDNSAGSLNFVSSPVTGNWPSRTTSAAVTINPPIGVNLSNSQQQLLQLPKQHLVQQHQQPPATTSRSKTQTTKNMPVSSVRSKFSSNAAILPQTVPQSNTAAQSTLWKNSARTPAYPTTNVLGVKNFPQQPSRSPQGQTQVSFGVNIKSGLLPEGQEIPTSSQSVSPMIVGSPPGSANLKTSSTDSKVGSSVPTLQSQQSENSSTGNGQKSSPVCGRNMPSILSTYPSHLSELKY